MSADVQQALTLSQDKGDTRTARDPFHRRPSFHPIHKKHKGEDVKQCRYCRKRNQRFMYQDKHGGGPAVKRRKKDVLIPPTKFLLGGNIRDPLNLNSLRDEEVNRRLNAVTPETSPMPTPQWKKGEVEVLLPPNIHDPLNLEGEGSRSPLVYSPPLKKNRKKHKKKKHRLSNEQSKSEVCEEGSGDISSSIENAGEIVTEMVCSECGGTEEVQTVVLSAAPLSDITCDISTTSASDASNMMLPPPSAPIKKVDEAPSDPPAPLEPPAPQPPPVPPNTLPLAKPQDLPLNKKGKTSGWKKAVDKIVSPVVKQPGACGTSGPRRKPHQAPLPLIKPHIMPKFKESNKKYQYGNYNRYYGYRNADYDLDPRLRLLESRRDLFYGKEVLDIGCNTGHVTLAIAADLGAKRVVGLDLDRKLVEAARGNIKHYLRRGNTGQTYPVSMPLLYGPMPDSTAPVNQTFPHNITFLQGNYVLTSDMWVDLEAPQFDTILCLSVTKWFHLNWGDEGLKRAFRRMYAQLRPGGSLILEPQPWTSYKKKKNITETTWKNYQMIELFPQKFTQYLLSEQVGFTKCEMLGSPAHSSRGFQRAIKIYTKGTKCLTPVNDDNSAIESPLEKRSHNIDDSMPSMDLSEQTIKVTMDSQLSTKSSSDSPLESASMSSSIQGAEPPLNDKLQAT